MHKGWIVVVGLVSAALGISGCIENGGASTETPVSYTTISEGSSFSGIVSQRFEVIRDQESWTGLWLAHTRVTSPVPDQPVVNFDQDMVVAVHLGNKPTGGYLVKVTGVTEDLDGLKIALEAREPGANCIVTAALSQPYQMVTLPRSPKNASFQVTVVRTAC